MSWIRNNKVIDNHKPVMLNNLIKIMQKDKRERFIDCTFGAGGHTSALMSLYPNMVFFALDRDPMTEDLIKTKNITGENFFFFCDRFSRINNYKTKIFDLEPNDFLEKKTSYQQGYFNESINNFEIKTNFKISEQENTIDYKKITIFFDLGMSNIQLFDSKRGFSYQNTLAELNLSMDEESKSVSDFLNNDTEYNIFKVLNDFGEEYYSTNIATNIVKSRPLKNVGDLVKIIKMSTPYKGDMLQKALSRIFQSLRIFANSEIEELQLVLESLKQWAGARLIIVSFHSLEDRIVKHWMKDNGLNNELIFPDYEEIRLNYQARSAKMRTCIIV